MLIHFSIVNIERNKAFIDKPILSLEFLRFFWDIHFLKIIDNVLFEDDRHNERDDVIISIFVMKKLSALLQILNHHQNKGLILYIIHLYLTHI